MFSNIFCDRLFRGELSKTRQLLINLFYTLEIFDAKNILFFLNFREYIMNGMVTGLNWILPTSANISLIMLSSNPSFEKITESSTSLVNYYWSQIVFRAAAVYLLHIRLTSISSHIYQQTVKFVVSICSTKYSWQFYQ